MYSNLTRQYVFLGDLVHAEKYFRKLMEMPPETLIAPNIWLEKTMAIFYEANNQWEESNQALEEFKHGANFMKNTIVEVEMKLSSAWVLERQGRFNEAKILREEAGKIRREREERFEHADLQVYLMVRGQVVVGEELRCGLIWSMSAESLASSSTSRG